LLLQFKVNTIVELFTRYRYIHKQGNSYNLKLSKGCNWHLFLFEYTCATVRYQKVNVNELVLVYIRLHVHSSVRATILKLLAFILYEN